MSRGTPDTGLFKVASPTGFSPSVMPAFQLTSTRNFKDSAGPYPSHPFGYSVWALPRSLATTYGITFVFSSWGYLDVSVPPVSLRHRRCIRFCRMRVSPFGNPRFIGYLHLHAAYRSLSRPSSALSAGASPLRS